MVYGDVSIEIEEVIVGYAYRWWCSQALSNMVFLGHLMKSS